MDKPRVGVYWVKVRLYLLDYFTFEYWISLFRKAYKLKLTRIN